MSQRSRNRSRHQNNDDESDEEFIPSQSQSQSLTNQDEKKLAGQVCNMLLVGEMKKIPVKSADIKKTIIIKKNKSSYKAVMEKANQMMEHVFGYKIVALKDNSYILVNLLGATLAKFQKLSKDEEMKRGLLVTILTVIFMNEEKISARELESFLNALEDNLFSNSKHTIQNFIRQKYLDTKTEPSTDPPMVMYHWGYRAEAEFSKKEILEFACKVYGNMKPSMWTCQWKIVNE